MNSNPAPTSAKNGPTLVPHDRLIRLSQVKEIVGFGKTCIYAMIKAGNFPAPCKPCGAASRWSENAVMAWVASYTSPSVH